MKQKRIRYYGLIAGVFVALYLVSMFFATYLVKDNYASEYMAYLADLGYELRESFMNENRTVFSNDTSKYRNREETYFNYTLSMKNAGMDQYQMISMTVYDEKGNQVAKTGNMFGDFLHMYKFEDYFSEDEIERMIKMYPEAESEDSRLPDTGNLYIQLYYRTEYDGPVGVEFREYGSGDVVWAWTNVMTGPEGYADYDDAQSGYLFFPYLNQGRDAWENWQQDEWLQGFTEKEDDLKISEREHHFYSVSGGKFESEGDTGSAYYVFEWTDYESSEFPTYKYSIELRHRIHPWMAAMDYMKYIYLAGLILILLCMTIVFFSMKRIEEQRIRLEKQRRDFVNAAAHELKTPLGVIRGFAENVKENTVEEKKDYYLKQIIGQTEVMDDLVKEMICISKIDSDLLVLKRESLSVSEIIKEQIHKVQGLAEEKRIQINLAIQNDFSIDGDKVRLSKAFGNLLMNAVEHNYVEGKIQIIVDASVFMIENTGSLIPEEYLPHVCDMFFSGDESRHDNHKGLGLYLAKQIFEMHGLALEVRNLEEGVGVTVKRK